MGKLMKHKFTSLIFILATLLMWACSSSSYAVNATAFLPAEQAFVFSTRLERPDLLLAEWHIAPGYYLYSKRLHITVNPEGTADIAYPQGDFKYAEELGRYEVFSGNLSIPIQFKKNASMVNLSIAYQGCSEDGFCYPPIHKNIRLDLTSGNVSQQSNSELPTLLTNQQEVQNALQSQHIGVLLLLFVGLGLLLAFTPCVLPMIPILTSIIVGQKNSSTKKAFLLSFIYVMGMAITYSVAGILVASLGNSLQIWLQNPWVIGVTSGLFLLLALSLFGLYDITLPRHWHHRVSSVSNKQKSGTYVGVFCMGVLSTLIVSPCVTAPLVGVLMYIAQTGDHILGASALFALGIGMGIPLMLIGLSAGKWLPKSGPWMEAVKKVFGLLMLGMAIWMLSRILSSTVTVILWGVLLIILALFLTFYLSHLIPQRKLNRGLGLVAGLAGIILIIGGISMPDTINRWIHA
jgi:thiol:disulfide interchange protein DsbD